MTKRGRKTVWSEELGLGVKINRRFPKAIHKMLSEKAVKALLNRMAIDPAFKQRILVQVEES